MRTPIRVVLFSSVFVGGIAAIYWFTSYEDAGTTMLSLGGAAYALLCGYLYFQARTSGEADTEESPTAQAVEIGYFPAASVWPAALALGAVLTALGLVFGFWFLVVAAIFFVGGIIGFAVEAQAPH
jgi:hypothetical protein